MQFCALQLRRRELEALTVTLEMKRGPIVEDFGEEVQKFDDRNLLLNVALILSMLFRLNNINHTHDGANQESQTPSEAYVSQPFIFESLAAHCVKLLAIWPSLCPKYVSL
jgi:hypothetical protein